MPEYIKIGFTHGDVNERIKQLDRTGTPLPLKFITLQQLKVQRRKKNGYILYLQIEELEIVVNFLK